VTKKKKRQQKKIEQKRDGNDHFCLATVEPDDANWLQMPPRSNIHTRRVVSLSVSSPILERGVSAQRQSQEEKKGEKKRKGKRRRRRRRRKKKVLKGAGVR
jgi:hypothetical protein